jgi:2-polyprenyl-3-methyl-5-hydroxy-6-metoxy-1,4-benzoquinol methylase
MSISESVARTYADARFPRASSKERERLVGDWVGKSGMANGIASDFERRVIPLAGLKVLDAGSGNGGISLAFAARGAHVEGVDIEEDLVTIARAAATETNSSAHFTYYEGTTLPFADTTFDAAVSVSVLEHVTDPEQYLREIWRVLAPNGLFYLAFPNRLDPVETHTGLWFLSYLPLPFARLYTKLMKRNPLEDNNLHFYTYWDMRRMLQNCDKKGFPFSIKEEQGQSTNPLKRFVKRLLRVIGIPHQALLPHVMVILKKEG